MFDDFGGFMDPTLIGGNMMMAGAAGGMPPMPPPDPFMGGFGAAMGGAMGAMGDPWAGAGGIMAGMGGSLGGMGFDNPLGAIGAGIAGGGIRGGGLGLGAPRTQFGGFTLPGMGRGAGRSPFTMSPSFGARGGGGGSYGGGPGGFGGGLGGFGGGFGGEMRGGGYNPMAGQLYEQFNAKLGQANEANELRYRDMLNRSDQLYGRAFGALNSMSDQEKQDISRRFNESAASGQQSLVDRGLGNSTITENFRLANQEASSAEQRRLADAVAMRRIGLDTDLTGQRLGIMERKTEAAPDFGMMAQLAMQAGQGGGAPSYSYGSSYYSPLGGGFNYNDPSGGNPALRRRLGLG